MFFSSSIIHKQAIKSKIWIEYIKKSGVQIKLFPLTPFFFYHLKMGSFEEKTLEK